MTATKPRWIPKDAREVTHALGVCYVQDADRNGKPCFTVLAYRGDAGKSAFYESYRSAELRDKRVAEFFLSLEAHQAMVAERRADRSKPHTLTVGTIIYNSWGWEQTNIDWYVIVKTSASYVWLQPIAAESVPSEGVAPMSGHTQPVIPVQQITRRKVRDTEGNLVERDMEPTKHKANVHGQIHFEHGCGCVWDGRPKYESWYA